MGQISWFRCYVVKIFFFHKRPRIHSLSPEIKKSRRSSEPDERRC